MQRSVETPELEEPLQPALISVERKCRSCITLKCLNAISIQRETHGVVCEKSAEQKRAQFRWYG
jgi:hypothetical protein